MPPALAQDEIHLWQVGLMHDESCVERLTESLSADERARTAAFYFPDLKRRFTVARAALRQILAVYLGLPAANIVFRYGPLGKPALAERAEHVPVTFNVSHSGELALIVVGRGRDLGVDIEWMRPIDDIDGIAQQNFSPAERTALQRLSGVAKSALFFTYWTRKECLVKATGDGLSVPLTEVDVSTVVAGRAQAISIRDGAGTRRRFLLRDLCLPAGYAGALAAEGNEFSMSSLRWVPGASHL